MSDFGNIFRCPECKSDISKSMISDNKILCLCSAEYPIIAGVPDFLDTLNEESVEIKLDRINKSFSNQWSMFKYEGEYKTWDWDIKSRLLLFFKEMDMSPSKLNQKNLLDAGCGNGVLTSALTRFGCKTVGIDISDSVFRAKRECEDVENASLIFVKGSLTNPPLRDKSFDYIYSSGVLHHNKNTKEALEAVLPLLKDDGKIYVWLYRKRIIQILYAEPLRKITVHLPSELMDGFTYLLAYPFQLMRKINNAFRGRTYVDYSIDELQLSLHDTFSPTYVNQHDEEELLDWFKKNGLNFSKITKRERQGFGIVGSRKELV